MSFRRFSDSGSFVTYKAAYSAQIDWKLILDKENYDWLQLFEKGRNCAMNLVMPALLSLTSAICGPKSRIECTGGSFSSTLNQYLIAVCDPGGGKTLTYERVIEPVLQNLYVKHGVKIHLENYTSSSGMQKHQIASNGYGFLSSDEGHRVLSSVNIKQMKGEAERASICRMWNGKGDSIELSGGSRSFKSTSMSMCLYIQPQPLLSEMCCMTGSDGFLDRFLFIASRPILHNTLTIAENFQKLKESPMNSFETVFDKMFIDHRDGITYTLTDDAQREYNKSVDAYADSLNERYSLEQEDKENQATQSNNGMPDLCMTSSKDVVHILRLAAVIGILERYLSEVLHPDLDVERDIPMARQITKNNLEAAKTLYGFMVEHKSVFLQAVRSVQTQHDLLQPKKIMTFKSRVVRYLSRCNGPYSTLRDMQRHLKGSNKESILVALGTLHEEGYGEIASVGKPPKDIFLKVTPEELNNRGRIINIDEYKDHFFSLESVDRQLLAKCLDIHPNKNVIVDRF